MTPVPLDSRRRRLRHSQLRSYDLPSHLNQRHKCASLCVDLHYIWNHVASLSDICCPLQISANQCSMNRMNRVHSNITAGWMPCPSACLFVFLQIQNSSVSLVPRLIFVFLLTSPWLMTTVRPALDRKHKHVNTCRQFTFETQGRLLYCTYKDEEIASKKFQVFSYMTPCRLVNRCRRFGEAHCFHLQGLCSPKRILNMALKVTRHAISSWTGKWNCLFSKNIWIKIYRTIS